MNDKKISRRDFLIAAGCGCAGLVLAGSGCSRLLGTTPAAPNSDANGSGSNPSTELVILCDRLCSYPGRCGRYTDYNGTGRCDLSEGIPADQAASYAGPGGRGGRGG